MNSNYVPILSGRDKIRDSYEKNVNHRTALSVSKLLTSTQNEHWVRSEPSNMVYATLDTG